MLFVDMFGGSFGVSLVVGRLRWDCGVPGPPACPLKIQLSARDIEPTCELVRVSHMYIAPSLPPVAKTAESVLRNAAVLTERLCPLKTRDSTKFESRTSHSLAE